MIFIPVSTGQSIPLKENIYVHTHIYHGGPVRLQWGWKTALPPGAAAVAGCGAPLGTFVLMWRQQAYCAAGCIQVRHMHLCTLDAKWLCYWFMSLLYFNYFRLYCFYYEEFAVKQYATVSRQQPHNISFLLCLFIASFSVVLDSIWRCHVQEHSAEACSLGAAGYTI